MDGYTKLHARILTSSVWSEPDHVRILWITLLALADQGGMFEGSIRGLADLARLSPEKTADALAILESPDPHSSDGTSGERIVRLEPGVWRICNHLRYREKKTRKQIADLERQRSIRAQKRDATCSNVTTSHTRSRASEYEYSEYTDVPLDSETSEAQAVPDASKMHASRKAKKGEPPPRPDDVPEEVWQDWLTLRRAKKAPVTTTALKRLRSEADKAGLSLSSAMEICAQNGWQGFLASYVADKGRGGGDPAWRERFTSAPPEEYTKDVGTW